jgi:hypothetical protein
MSADTLILSAFVALLIAPKAVEIVSLFMASRKNGTDKEV